MLIIRILITVIICYLIGAINFSIIISKSISSKDIRKEGSGNPGGTNVLRTLGTKVGVLCIILDALKTIVGFFIAKYLIFMGSDLNIVTIALIVSIATMIGHVFPVYYKFKGGKAFACGAGMIFIVDIRFGLIILAVFLVLFFLHRMMSLAAVVSASAFPLYIAAFCYGQPEFILNTCLALIPAVIIIVRHRENIKRIFNGTEYKFSFKKAK